ncbi:MAG: transposase [Chlorobi bacterium]|nr:transposase [Chlorobiota bacterium]
MSRKPTPFRKIPDHNHVIPNFFRNFIATILSIDMQYHKLTNRQEKLICGETYHIYNKTVGGELLFITDIDYRYFLKKLERFIVPIAKIYTYCLLPNHFHLMLKIREEEEIPTLRKIDDEKHADYITRIFGNFFQSYSKSFNKTYQRQGRLFLQPFKRIKVDDEDYFVLLVNYIHRNPIHHGLVKELYEWRYSTYQTFLSKKLTRIDREEVLSFFGSLEEFVRFHEENKMKPGTEKYYLE